jgi:hypothetical protein
MMAAFSMRLLATFLLTMAGVASVQTCFAEDTALLEGKVVNAEGKPVGGARIVVYNEDTRSEKSGRSDRRGDFEIAHPLCSALSFDVFPPEKCALASAHYAHVSGEMTKHFIVKLASGFHVTGRVLAEGQGVKGLEIKVFPQSSQGSDTVHGGGSARTKAEGEYSLYLTPGQKTIQIKNDLYSNLSPLYQHEFKITQDTRLPDMTLPLLKDR